MLTADGFYYDEVAGAASSAPLNLSTVVDLKDQPFANVNLLNHLGWVRAEYLIGQGSTYATALSQAQTELLAMLDFSPPNPVENFNQLDVSQDGEDNAVLLAASVIFQGTRSVAELSQLIADVAADFREDGTLDEPRLGSELIDGIRDLPLAPMRENLTGYYTELGETVTVPPFEKYVRQFIENTDFVYTLRYEYPATGEFGVNLLADTLRSEDTVRVAIGETFSLRALVPENNVLHLEIIRARTFNEGPSPVLYGGYNDTWKAGPFDNSFNTNWFTVGPSPDPEDMRVRLGTYGGLTINFYENSTEEAVRTQNIIWGDPVLSTDILPIIVPPTGRYGPNLLQLINMGQTTFSPGTYSLSAYLPPMVVPRSPDLRLIMRGTSSANHNVSGGAELIGWMDEIRDPSGNSEIYFLTGTNPHTDRYDTLDARIELLDVRDSLSVDLSTWNPQSVDLNFVGNIYW